MINLIIALMLFCVFPSFADASPAQSGSSGLINVSSAETIDAGNICIGVWSCYGENQIFSQKSSLIMPVTITLGIGTFWEVYGAYPNIFFNGDDDISGRGTLDLGTKLRFLGGRSSDLKVAVDLLGQRHVSESRDIDGATDISAKIVASYNKNDFGVHVSAGYLKAGAIKKTTILPTAVDTSLNSSYGKTTVSLGDEFVFGAGVEYTPIPRLKLLTEIVAGTDRYYVEDTNPYGTEERNRVNSKIFSAYSVEASIGAQYFLNPHFTLNSSLGTGLGPNDPEIKFIFGISSCQGVGTYVNPIPSVGRRVSARSKIKEALKPLKIIPISTLLLKASAPQSAPVSKLEVELEPETEEILIKPYGQIVISPQQASSNLTSPVIPVEIPLKSRDEEITLQPLKTEDREASAIDYTLDRIRGISPLFGIDVKGSQVTLPPAVALPERMSVYRKFRFPDVTFDFDQWTLSEGGKKMLSEVAEQIRKDKKWLYIKIDGHTDSIGSLSYNMDLSLKRAIAAASYLISHEGVDPSKVFIKGLGKSVPIAENNTVSGRRKNRRTEILFLVAKEGQ
ncbi:MAG: OmpA family protein [Desulfuromonadaceae bacterium]|nr:OmpA family protein [Desulfuromonadaceae bacterium]MDD2855481.1 OmpA family protein [Desulfuromonadaceae bacterium]